MTPIDDSEDLQKYYQDQGVVAQYLERRTTQPLNGLLHRRQVAFLNDALRRRAAAAVLEIACGPGRLTAALRGVRFGVATDASQPMLEAAQQRMNGTASHWSLLRSDAFVLPFRAESFEAVYTLRFVRHFQLPDRQRLYGEVLRVLKPRGLFMIDALNRAVSLPYRLQRGVESYHIYDELYRREEIEAELHSVGFRVVAVESIIKHPLVQRRLNRLRLAKLGRIASALIASLEYIPGGTPTDWMLLCEKRP